MKYVKQLGLLIFAAIVLAALAGVSTATATVLCKNNLNTEKCSERYPVGTEFKTVNVGSITMHAGFKTVECHKASGEGKLESEGSSTTTPWGKGTGTYAECNCEVKVLKTGTLEVHYIAGTDNGTVTFNGSEVTVTCASIFGNVHCIYVTVNTDTGPVTGGNPAIVHIEATIPREPTNGLCSEESFLTATFEVTAPKPLYVAAS